MGVFMLDLNENLQPHQTFVDKVRHTCTSANVAPMMETSSHTCSNT